MIIKLCDDKSLLITRYERIYQGENRADIITFLVPQTYGEIVLGDCDARLNYIDANNNYHTTPLTKELELYNDYHMYRLSVTTLLTAVAGTLTLSVTFRDKSSKMVLKSGSISFTIEERGEIIDPTPPTPTEVQIQELMHRVSAIEYGQAANLSLEDRQLALENSSGEMIGDAVELPSEVPVVMIDEEGTDG